MNQEIYLRAHTILFSGLDNKSAKKGSGPIWPDRILTFDTETTIDDARQELTFGAYQLCELQRGSYICSEEGLFFQDDLNARQRGVLTKYIDTHFAEIEVASFPPRIDLKLYQRWEFVEKVFWKAIRDGRMIVGFNLPFDLSRLAVDWKEADNGGWSLILSQRVSTKTGAVEPNPYKPRVRFTAKDSKTAFISLTKPQEPKEWPKRSRFLDVHTLAFSLFAQSFPLNALCNELKVTGKINHEPTGKITRDEIDYCRGDVRATIAALNALKKEFGQHALDLHPDRAYSPASLAKSHLLKMGLVQPGVKFQTPDEICGIAMQAYYGGRAECRIRHTPVPVVHTDFKSQYPTVNTLLQNWEILIAESLSFDSATHEVHKLLETVTLDRTFDPAFWKELKFFALVKPGYDVLPVRTIYNGQTQNIGINELSADFPMWFAGPDLVASTLLRGKPPQIIKAIRIVPHGTQKGLTPTSLCGKVNIDPIKDDFFRCVIEERVRNKSNPTLERFLKVLANSGSYGLFVEVTPETSRKPQNVGVFSGDTHFEHQGLSFENHGQWYFPPIAALITAGGRLLLAMLERSVTERSGSYLFCDTDSLCIVATESGGPVECEEAGGTGQIHALSWKEVEAICHRFRLLNPYDSQIVPDLLKIEDINFNSDRKQRQLFGYAISAKRYALYERSGDELNIVDPKAHGLGYLYPPVKRRGEDEDWTFAAWEYILRDALGLPNVKPSWLDCPAMMQIKLGTPHMLKRLNKSMRPANFVLCPLIDSLIGYPVGVNREQFTLMTPFTKDRDKWMRAKYINIYDTKVYSLALVQTPRFDKMIPETFGQILRTYPYHPEYKSLAPDGTPCDVNTRGLLQRMHVVASHPHYIGKETDRKWDHGEDFSLLTFKPAQFDELGKIAIADPAFIEKLLAIPMKKIARSVKIDRNTIRKMCRGLPVRLSTIQRVTDFLAGSDAGTAKENPLQR